MLKRSRRLLQIPAGYHKRTISTVHFNSNTPATVTGGLKMSSFNLNSQTPDLNSICSS